MEKKVLIVDDEQRIIQSITGVLRTKGFALSPPGVEKKRSLFLKRSSPM